MEKSSNKIDFISLIAIVFFAISISVLDFDDLSLTNNFKCYIGILFSVILIVLKYKKLWK